VGAAIVASAGTSVLAYGGMFFAAFFLPTVVVLFGAVLMTRRSTQGAQRERLFSVIAALATFTLVQLPFAAPIYFCYVAPVLSIGALAVLSEMRVARSISFALAGVFAIYGVVRLHPGHVYSLGVRFRPYNNLVVLDLPRAGGIRVPPRYMQLYGRLVPLIREHAGGDSAYIYAAPDAPEVYFLTGLRNPTRTMYDFFDDTTNRSRRILDALDAHNVKVAVLNRSPGSSPNVDIDLRAGIERRYSNVSYIGDFEVRWRTNENP
jgi:hypothetical protein